MRNEVPVVSVTEVRRQSVPVRTPVRVVRVVEVDPAPAPGPGGLNPGQPVGPVRNVVPVLPGVFVETRAWSNGDNYASPFLFVTRFPEQAQAGAVNVICLHELYAPFQDPRGYDMGLVTDLLRRTAATGRFSKVCVVDPEQASYKARGHWVRLCQTIRAAGFIPAVAPKITLDISGHYMADAPNYTGTLRLLQEHAEAFMIWGYGNAAGYIEAVRRLRASGLRRQLVWITDTFRNDPERGYVGAIHGMTILKAAAAAGEASLIFQAWAASDQDQRAHSGLYRR